MYYRHPAAITTTTPSRSNHTTVRSFFSFSILASLGGHVCIQHPMGIPRRTPEKVSGRFLSLRKLPPQRIPQLFDVQCAFRPIFCTQTHTPAHTQYPCWIRKYRFYVYAAALFLLALPLPVARRKGSAELRPLPPLMSVQNRVTVLQTVETVLLESPPLGLPAPPSIHYCGNCVCCMFLVVPLFLNRTTNLS